MWTLIKEGGELDIKVTRDDELEHISGSIASKPHEPPHWPARSVLTFSRVRHAMLRGNKIHSVTVWTLGIPKNVYGNPRLLGKNYTLKFLKVGQF